MVLSDSFCSLKASVHFYSFILRRWFLLQFYRMWIFSHFLVLLAYQLAVITDPTTPCVRVGKVSCFLTKDQIDTYTCALKIPFYLLMDLVCLLPSLFFVISVFPVCFFLFYLSSNKFSLSSSSGTDIYIVEARPF